MMYIFLDCEGEPVQEFSAIYVDFETGVIEDVFHHHVHYPFKCDYDYFARQHVHGLDRNFLSLYGLRSEQELLNLFHEWLKSHPFQAIYAHAPAKEVNFLSLPVKDVCLKPWKDRIQCQSHQIALSMKLYKVPVCGVTCAAHSLVCWKPKKILSPNASDRAKMEFSYHCSLYDCIECFLFLFYKN